MSPDVSWVPKSVLVKFGKRALSKVTGPVVTPVFVIEVRSPSDRLPQQMNKCERWIKAGVPEVWLVDPIKRNVHVFFPGSEATLLKDPKRVTSGVLDGFVLDCEPVWED